jgi:hypothetical protein
MAELEEALPKTVLVGLQDQLMRIDGIEADIDRLEKQIGTWQKQDAECGAIAGFADRFLSRRAKN